MDILKTIEEAYDIEDMEWLIPEKSFTSNRGNKRIQYWENLELLEWHINWRDEIGKHQTFLVDRMIRTKSNKAYIHIGDRYVTIHDDELGNEPSSIDEKMMGSFIGNMLEYGTKHENSNLIKETSFPKEMLIKYTGNSRLSGEESKLLARVLTEARKRLKLSENLTENAKDVHPPITDCMESLDQCNSVFGMFFWKSSNKPPQNAYHGLRYFLASWKAAHGEASLRDLMSEIDKTFPIHQEQGNLLLAEIVKPWEVISLLKELQDVNSIELQRNSIQQFRQEWEAHRELVSVVAEWIDLSRKKVVQ